MAGRLIIHAPNQYMGILGFHIYMDGKKVKTLRRGESATFEIEDSVAVQANVGFYAKSPPVQVQNFGVRELHAGIHLLTWACVLNEDGDIPANTKIVSVMSIAIMLAAIIAVLSMCDFSGSSSGNSGSFGSRCGNCGGDGWDSANSCRCVWCGGDGITVWNP